MKLFDMRGQKNLLSNTRKRMMTTEERKALKEKLYGLAHTLEEHLGYSLLTLEDFEEEGDDLEYIVTSNTCYLTWGLDVLTTDNKRAKLHSVFCLKGDNKNMYGIAFDVDDDFEEVGEGYLVRF